MNWYQRCSMRDLKSNAKFNGFWIVHTFGPNWSLAICLKCTHYTDNHGQEQIATIRNAQLASFKQKCKKVRKQIDSCRWWWWRLMHTRSFYCIRCVALVGPSTYADTLHGIRPLHLHLSNRTRPLSIFPQPMFCHQQIYRISDGVCVCMQVHDLDETKSLARFSTSYIHFGHL